MASRRRFIRVFANLGCSTRVRAVKAKHFVVLSSLVVALLASRFWRSERSDRVRTPTAQLQPNEAGDENATDRALRGSLHVVTAAELKSELRRLAGKGSLVNVWATWCGPCKRELPMLVSLRQRLTDLGISLVFVSVDEPEDASAVADFLAQHDAPGPSYLVGGSLEQFKRELNPRWPGMLPASFLFDASAELHHFFAGEVFEEELMPLVEDFAAGKDVDGESHFGLAPGRVDEPSPPPTEPRSR